MNKTTPLEGHKPLYSQKNDTKKNISKLPSTRKYPISIWFTQPKKKIFQQIFTVTIKFVFHFGPKPTQKLFNFFLFA